MKEEVSFVNNLLPKGEIKSILDVFGEKKDLVEFRRDIKNQSSCFKNNLGEKYTSEACLLVTNKSYSQVVEIYGLLSLGVVGSISQPDDFDILKNANELKCFKYVISKQELSLSERPFKLKKKEGGYFFYENNLRTPRLESCCWIFQTSGTTGRRKLVGVSRKNFMDRISSEKRVLSLSENSYVLNYLNLNHELGFYNLISTISIGCKTMIRNILSGSHFVNELNDLCVSAVLCVPKIVNMLDQEKVLSKLESLTHLKNITISGGSATYSTEERFFNSLPKTCVLIKTYGQTETSRTLINLIKKNSDLRHLGRPEVDVRVKLTNKGELVHEGAGSAQMIFDAVTNKFKSVNDVKTGDFFEQTNEGNYRFVGRKDRLIKLHGNRVSLDEIENIVMDSGLLLQCACIQVKDLNLFIKLETSVGMEDFEKWIELNLPKYISFKQIISLRELPVGPSGKVSYSLLKEKIGA